MTTRSIRYVKQTYRCVCIAVALSIVDNITEFSDLHNSMNDFPWPLSVDVSRVEDAGRRLGFRTLVRFSLLIRHQLSSVLYSARRTMIAALCACIRY